MLAKIFEETLRSSRGRGEMFKSNIENLFDIAHTDALQLMKTEGTSFFTATETGQLDHLVAAYRK